MTLTRPDCVIRIKDKDHYLVKDIEEMFGVDWRTVMRWLEDGKLTRVEYPNGICVPADEVESFYRARKPDGDRPQGAPRPGPKPSDGPGRQQ
jgi:hypothetical protein